MACTDREGIIQTQCGVCGKLQNPQNLFAVSCAARDFSGVLVVFFLIGLKTKENNKL